MKAFRASSASGCGVTAANPRLAAVSFFEKFPTLRKCNVIEGEDDGHFFTVAYGRASEGKWPRSWKGVTKKNLNELPEGEQS